jgi:hypothetical protein
MGQAPGLLDTYMYEPDIGNWQASSWSGYANWIVGTAQQDPNSAPMTLCVGLPMVMPSDSSSDQAFKDIASGKNDAAFKAMFDTFATKYHTLYIRPGWEMNGNWEPWSVNSSNAQDFIAAFQHIANLAHSYIGMTIRVDWNPNAANVGQFPVEAQNLYPGNQYVDNISIDEYAGGGFPPDSAALNTSGWSIQTAAQFALAHSKPLGLDEIGALRGDTNYPADVAKAISNVPGVVVDHVNIWDDPSGSGSGSLYWSDQPAVATAWKQAFATISADSANGGTTQPPPPPTGGGGQPERHEDHVSVRSPDH